MIIFIFFLSKILLRVISRDFIQKLARQNLTFDIEEVVTRRLHMLSHRKWKSLYPLNLNQRNSSFSFIKQLYAFT